ncbi:MAG TPA: S9 family peptidase [Candidatus Acidoferrales bacterium]|nr:S9 family peptidase [Candidatus Acidoferrales bacterium]
MPNRIHRYLPAAALALVVLPLATVRAQNQAPTIDQSLEMRTVSSPSLSPNGQLVAYEVQWTNWNENQFQQDIWIADTVTGQTYRLTDGKQSSAHARWSPDGDWIAFLSARPGSAPDAKQAKEPKEQIYLISPFGGEARQLTQVETGVTGFEWSPDGRRIAFTAPDPESTEHKAREEKYGDFRIIGNDYTMTHLWVIDLRDPQAEKMPAPERITSGQDFTVGSFTWSPDGARIAFDAARDPALADLGTADVYVVTLADKSVKKLVNAPGPDTHPIWSPDGSRIAYSTANGDPHFFYTNRMIAVVPAAGGAPQVLTKTFDEDAYLANWGPDGIYFGALQRTYSHLFLLNPQTMVIDRVTSPDSLHANSFSFSRDFKRVALVMAPDNSMPEIAVSAVDSFAPTTLTRMNDQGKPFFATERDLVEWKSADGTPIEGVLTTPAHFAASKKYPLLVVIHGGPTGVSTAELRPDRYYPIEQFVAKGALVLEPNYRGSAGYGSRFRALNVRNLGVGDYADVISGVDSLIAKGFVDPARVGAMGWSEGGYISAFITASSDRFRAVSVGAGISDWMTYYVNTDITPFTQQYLLATPWKDPAIYAKTSPITYVLHARTPTLIQQGSMDARVPVPDSFELHQALVDLGVPVKFVLYTGFGHPITKPKQQRAVMQENLNWFGHYIWGDPLRPVQ